MPITPEDSNRIGEITESVRAFIPTAVAMARDVRWAYDAAGETDAADELAELGVVIELLFGRDRGGLDLYYALKATEESSDPWLSDVVAEMTPTYDVIPWIGATRSLFR